MRIFIDCELLWNCKPVEHTLCYVFTLKRCSAHIYFIKSSPQICNLLKWWVTLTLNLKFELFTCTKYILHFAHIFSLQCKWNAWACISGWCIVCSLLFRSRRWCSTCCAVITRRAGSTWSVWSRPCCWSRTLTLWTLCWVTAVTATAMSSTPASPSASLSATRKPRRRKVSMQCFQCYFSIIEILLQFLLKG